MKRSNIYNHSDKMWHIIYQDNNTFMYIKHIGGIICCDMGQPKEGWCSRHVMSWWTLELGMTCHDAQWICHVSISHIYLYIVSTKLVNT